MNPVIEKNDRRCGIDRRQTVYTAHIPERRSGKDRRTGDGPNTDKNIPQK